MSNKIIDCRGLSCPRPVLETKKVLDEYSGEEVDVILDDETACQNVSLYAAGRNWAVNNIDREGTIIRLSLKRKTAETCETITSAQAKQETFLVYLSSETIGHGDDELGKLLMRSFIQSLFDTPPLPKRMIFLNSGVKLATEGSLVLDALRAFEDKGVEIVSCGTCLDYFRLKDKLRVGKVTNMFDIISSLQSFEKVVQP
jgi:selenium metabolism protein YedF